MPRRVWLSLGMLATGVVLIVVAQMADAAPEGRGGIFKVGTTGASVQIDPQLSYVSTGWWLEYATAAKLYNYRPGGNLVPEVASHFTVSNGGKTYTFFIRKGFRFSDGSPVTAWSFKYAINRAANHELQSPGAQFITDPTGVDIAGARDVNNGRGINVGGVRVRGNRLIVELKRPSGKLISILALPFFQATSSRLQLTKEVVNVSGNDLPSAGPYYVSRNAPDELTSLRRNPYWKPGPGRTAPRNLAGVDLQWNVNEQTAFEQVKANQLDEGPIPAAEAQNLANEYGVNRSRFWVKPTSSCIGLMQFNNSRGLFEGNAPMRKAVNWALDRTAYNGPSFTRSPWTHLLPPTYPGSITTPRLQPYAPTARLEKARALAAGHFKDGRITVYFRSTGSLNLAQAEIVRRTLLNLGFDDANITMKGFAGGDIYDAMGKRGFDLGISLGWCGFGGEPPVFPDVLRYRDKIAAALRLKGNARAAALGKLDVQIMKNVAPVVVTNTFNNLYFFSNRVDPRSLSYHRVYDDWSIPNLALK
jgi:ABC-type transport system substrate-binding protein